MRATVRAIAVKAEPSMSTADMTVAKEWRVDIFIRALSDLAHQLLDATAKDIEAITHQPADLPR